MKINEEARKAKEAFKDIRNTDEEVRNRVLDDFARLLIERSSFIIGENEKDIEAAKKNGLSAAFIDRLTLNEDRIKGMSLSVRKVMDLPDPLGRIIEDRTLESGIRLKKVTVPLGLIGIIFESRPNVAADCAALCLKSGNACILKGGKESLASCRALCDLFREALEGNGLNKNAVVLLENVGHEQSKELMNCREYIDLLIPRGSSRLINAVVSEASVPVIETGAGICHVFVDESADLKMARDIVINAKCSRPSVCNAMETLLVHEKIADRFVPMITEELYKRNVIIHGDENSRRIVADILKADEENFRTEYNDLEMNLAIVSSVEEAVRHIEEYGTHHSDCIVTENDDNASFFFRNVDSACLYHNASTRFTDGEMFGLGSEIGISTQKTHVRGPMGLEALTTYTYRLEGKGQIR